MKLKPGMLLVLETGEYSDYTFHGPFVILREFDQAEAVAEHSALWKRDFSVDVWRDTPDCYSFMAWLTTERFIEHAQNVVSWHIGHYGELQAEAQSEAVTLPKA